MHIESTETHETSRREPAALHYSAKVRRNSQRKREAARRAAKAAREARDYA